MVVGKREYLLWGAIIILLLLLTGTARSCISKNKRANENLLALTDTILYYKNRLGTETASVRTLQLNKSELQKLVLNKDAKLKALTKEFASVKSVVKHNTTTRFDTIRIPFEVKVPCNFVRSDSVRTRHYSFEYMVDQDGLTLDKFMIPNEVTILTGYKRKWLLGKKILTTEITNSNPHIKVEGITAAEIVVPEPWYKKWYIWLAAGMVTGTLIK